MLGKPSSFRIRQCSQCHGLKREYNISTGQVERCGLCFGLGYVSMNICRGCGRPAFKTISLGTYCGRDECFKLLFRVCDAVKFVDIIESTCKTQRHNLPVTVYGCNLTRIQRIDSRILNDMNDIHQIMNEALNRQRDDPHFVNPDLDDEESYHLEH
jgi:hypothetical protein